MDYMDGTAATVDVSKPGFIVVEAKRTKKLPEASEQAELIGQLTSQLIRTYNSLHFFISVGSFILISPCLYILVNSQRLVDKSWRAH